MTTERIHLGPPPGSGLTPCCDRSISELPTGDRVTSDRDEVTCTDRDVAELVVDTDRGENPFGWSENTVKAKAPALAAVLVAVRRQCIAWTTQPTGAAHRDTRNRDHGVNFAAGVLLAVIDGLLPGLDEPDQDEAAQRPNLTDRFAAVLVSTSRADWPEHGPTGLHGTGHRYDARCALCTGDVEALAAALAAAITRTPLPPLGNL